MELFDRVKQHVRGRCEPKQMLRRTIVDGLLYHLGLWLLDEYLDTERHVEKIEGEYLVWHLDDIVQFLATHGVGKSSCVVRARQLVATIDELYANDEDAYFRRVDSSDFHERVLGLHSTMMSKHDGLIARVRPAYARNYASRVFHDRELCEHISKLLVTIGFDGQDQDDDEPKQWVARRSIPMWARKAVMARDRGRCAQCGAAIVLELEDVEHIDHIVPLSMAGTNDLVNLQLLCAPCNLRKTNAAVPVTSSIPAYLQSDARRGRRASRVDRGR